MLHPFSRWRQLMGWIRPAFEPESHRSASTVLQYVARNVKGRDMAVGDIHGSFDALQRALDRVGFDPAVDRLFSVGDLVDRGPQSHRVLEWLAKPWFFAVCGNHDYMIWRSQLGHAFPEIDPQRLGNAWFGKLSHAQRAAIGRGLQALPLAIEVDTAGGPVGLVHASCPDDWHGLQQLDMTQLDDMRSAAGRCLWSTRRVATGDVSRVRNIRAVIHGHVTVRSHLALGNVHFIDTGGWCDGRFTLLDLASLRPARQSLRARARTA